MRRILAIAAIAIRNAVRSRMVLCLVGLLLLAVIGLPLTLKGDGTVEGQLRITITYSLGAAFGLLALASLWAGALSISREVEERQIQMLAVKPVYRAELWLGKWLGLMAVNAGLLFIAGAATLALLPHGRIGDEGAAPSNWRDVYRAVAPQPEDLEPAARALLAERRQSGEIDAQAPTAAALAALRQELRVRTATVAPGQRRDWVIALSHPLAAQEQLRLRYRFSSSRLGLAPVRGRWLVGTPERPAQQTVATHNPPGVYQVAEVPATGLAGARVLAVTFVNEDPGHITVVFDPQDGLNVLLPAGSFVSNYARALLLLLCRLGLLTALGVTAGALFSSPVALFMALALMWMAQLAGYTAEFATPGESRAWIDAPARALQVILKPLAAPPALDAVATGLQVQPEWLARGLIIQLGLYGGALGLLGIGVLNRRELALPTT